MRHLILSSVGCRAVLHFFTLSHERQGFFGEGGAREGDIENKMCVLICYTILSETLLILTRIQRHNTHHKCAQVFMWSSPYYSCHILIPLEFPLQIFEKSSNINLTKIRPVAAESFHADGRTDRQMWRSWQSLFAILWTRLKTDMLLAELQFHITHRPTGRKTPFIS